MRGRSAVVCAVTVFLVAVGCGTEKAPETRSKVDKQSAASVAALGGIKDEMDALDRKIQASGTPKPTSLAEVKDAVEVWRPMPGRYQRLLAKAKPLALRAQRLNDQNLGVGSMWTVLLEMLRQRRDGMRETVVLFDKFFADHSYLPRAQARLGQLKREGDVLNARFARLAVAYNEKVGG
jgi:hypothetical protein